MPAFNLPLNLPHAATVAHRILHHLRGRGAPDEALERAGGLIVLLEPWRDLDDNGPAEAAEKARLAAAALGRAVVADIEKSGVGYDRLGQAVRNLFECLSLGEEGALLSLRAGENPGSTLRPS
ncbi:MAG TPA: hypothetical protein VNM14_07185 [Planctomycetota bacterium]|jgi:hypothetical protein|nr:hypothetical protein [Planctomycetota bacterium]